MYLQLSCGEWLLSSRTPRPICPSLQKQQHQQTPSQSANMPRYTMQLYWARQSATLLSDTRCNFIERDKVTYNCTWRTSHSTVYVAFWLWKVGYLAQWWWGYWRLFPAIAANELSCDDNHAYSHCQRQTNSETVYLSRPSPQHTAGKDDKLYSYHSQYWRGNILVHRNFRKALMSIWSTSKNF